MFSLKFAALLPVRLAARAFKLQKPKPPPGDARAAKRMRDELSAAREAERARLMRHRYHVI